MSVAHAQPRTQVESELGGEVSPGAVYTPGFLAEWVADRLLRSLPEGARTVVDFACGEGALLAALAARSPRPLELIGTDVDAAALERARTALPGARFEWLDAFAAALGGPDGFRERLGTARPAGIVLNPPWGIEVGPARVELREAGLQLAAGQFDSADLFLELAVNLLEEGGAAALILPDSLFFPDRAPLRRFLLETCTLDLVARLGEGFFPRVFRGVAVVVLRRGAAPERHAVECVRLSGEQRKLVLSGETGLDAVAAAAAHSVPQARFAAAPGASFSIDLRQDDVKHVRAVYRQEASWTRTLRSGRGVELSKHGEIVDCPACGRARPRPRRAAAVACACGESLDPERLSTRKIVRTLDEPPGPGWRPLIAGEDVRRYHAAPSREIRTGIDGINYKLDIDLRQPRLLVRKTGIGLKAALYNGDVLTTQTVFHYQATADSPDFLLAYALGVISSRVMLAVHLKRSGEFEWRSHPYVTQTLLAELPIPHPAPGSRQWLQAEAIAARAARLSDAEPGSEPDLEIERLVAGLYGLEAHDMAWVEGVLDEFQGMEGITSLRFPAGADVTPVLAG
jgi:adenine-specific DNA-methyltransferase